MANNLIYPFATGNGANVPSDVAWAGDSALPQGFQTGRAASAKVNKALRQSTAVASGYGQFVAQWSGQDFTDSLTPSVMATNARIAMAAALAGAYVTKDTSNTPSALVASLNPAPPAVGIIAFTIQVANTNTTGNVTLNLNNLGPIAVVRRDGSALQVGDLVGGIYYSMLYDGTQYRLLSLAQSDIAALASAITRTRLSANTTLYVNSTTGSDTTGNGTQAAPFASGVAAYNLALTKLDLAGFNLTISCAGAFTTGIAVNGLLPGQTGPVAVTFDGGGSATITSTGSCFYAGAGALINVQNFGPLSSTGTGYAQGCALYAIGGATIVFNNLTLAACAVAHLSPQSGGTILSRNILNPGTGVTLSVTGSSPCCLNSGLQGTLYVNGITINLPSNVNFSYGFASAFQGNLQAAGITFTGGATITGRRYYIDAFGYIFVNGAGVNYFPGSIAGAINGTEGDYR